MIAHGLISGHGPINLFAMLPADTASIPRMHRLIPVLLCAALIALFAAVAWYTASNESATPDEPVYVLGGWINRNSSDFRLNTEHPPLWKDYAAILNRTTELSLDTTSKSWTEMNRFPENEWDYALNTLFQTPNNPGGQMLMRSRAMMIPLGVLLALVICAWTWQLAGPSAAVLACALLCLDPNFIAHTPLVVNDVPMALIVCALAFALWNAGRELTWRIAIAIPLLAALGPNIKATGLLLGPVAAVVLFIRALAPWPWRIFGRPVSDRRIRTIWATTLCIAMVAATFLLTWAVYGFRFNPTPDPAIQMDAPRLLNIIREDELRSQHINPASMAAARSAWTPGLFLRLDLFALDHRLLPQAYLFGLLFNYATTRGADAFLLNQYSPTGWWYYFPVAFLLKTPVTTLLIIAAAVGAAGIRFFTWLLRRRAAVAKNEPTQPIGSAQALPPSLWLSISAGVPMIALALFAITSNLNIGIRHILPIISLIYVAVSPFLSRLWTTNSRAIRTGLVILFLALGSEATIAYPYYISYFNVLAGGWRGGIDLLGDSNLDWGQDLLRLRRWQLAHQHDAATGAGARPLYLAFAYPGSVDPHYCGLSFFPLLINSNTGPRLYLPRGSADLGVSASLLQATDLQGSSAIAAFFTTLRQIPPDEIVGSTLYIYHVPRPDLPLR